MITYNVICENLTSHVVFVSGTELYYMHKGKHDTVYECGRQENVGKHEKNVETIAPRTQWLARPVRGTRPPQVLVSLQ